MSNKVPTITSIAITITNHCIKIVGTVSAKTENGLVDITVICLPFLSVFFSILIKIDQQCIIDINYVDNLDFI